MKLTKKQKVVYDAIQAVPEAANDDKLLLATIWQERWIDGLSLYENLKRVPNPESITRSRRKLHEMGYIKYSKEADDRRMEEFNNHRDEYGTPILFGMSMGDK